MYRKLDLKWKHANKDGIVECSGACVLALMKNDIAKRHIAIAHQKNWQNYWNETDIRNLERQTGRRFLGLFTYTQKIDCLKIKYLNHDCNQINVEIMHKSIWSWNSQLSKRTQQNWCICDRRAMLSEYYHNSSILTTAEFCNKAQRKVHLYYCNSIVIVVLYTVIQRICRLSVILFSC